MTAVSCESHQDDEKSVSGISVSPAELELQIGEKGTVVAELLPEGVSSEIIWRSSNEDVAEVDGSGEVSAISEGYAEISAAADGFSAICNVTVIKPVERKLNLDKHEIVLVSGAMETIIAEYSPQTLMLQWSSSDNSVATVDQNGKVTAISEGVATIKATVEEMSAECSVTVLGEPSLGDYYYSDGTYSSELDKDKTVVGVVFWTGDPTEGDITLKNDFPWCTHGLAVAVKEGENTTWQMNYAEYDNTVSEWIANNASEYEVIITGTEDGSNLNKIMGYNNTKAIEAFNASIDNADWPVEAVQQVVAFRKDNPAPAMSSGWYLPSIKELSLLCTGVYDDNIWNIYGDPMIENMKYINTRLEKIQNIDPLDDDGGYYSSSESTWDVAYGMFFYNGYVGQYYKYADYNKTRCILAF